MATNRAIWYVAGTKKSPHGTLYINCNVKPGANKSREGIASIGEDAIDVCVAAQAREGEANKAVVKVISEVILAHGYGLGIFVPRLMLSIGAGPPQIEPSNNPRTQVQE